MKHQLTKTHIIGLIFLVVILLGLFYYRLVYIPIQERIAALNTDDIQAEIDIESARALQIRRMREEIEQNKSENSGEIAVYDNQTNAMIELDTILSGVENYQLAFQTPVAAEDAVRRNVNITFTAPSYARAAKVIEQIYDCKYRCLITGVNLSPEDDKETLQDGSVECSLTVTFYETLYGAETKDGLG